MYKLEFSSNMIYHQVLTYLYFVLPIIIFLFGWMAMPYNVLASVVMLVSFYFCLQDKWKYNNIIKLSSLFSIFLIIIIIVLFSGIGNYSFQNSDHYWRNTIFDLLVEKPWPVVTDEIVKGIQEQRLMIYYIGFWMVPAVIGKIFGLGVGYFACYLWACLGLYLVWFNLCRYNNSFKVKTLILFLAFSGLDAIGVQLVGEPGVLWGNNGTNHLEWWTGIFQYTANTTQLFWVFNQAIYAWLITLVVIQEKTNRHMNFIMACCMINSTLPFLGIIPFALYRAFINYANLEEQSVKSYCRETFTFENAVGGVIIAALSFLYLTGNDAGGISGMLAMDNIYIKLLYLLFLFLEVGIYLLLVYPYHKGTLYWLVCCVLAFCPIYRIGMGMDFCMRVSIPALTVLFLMVCDTLEKAKRDNKFFLRYLLVITLCVGSITPIHEVWRSMVYTYQSIEVYGKVHNPTAKQREIMGEINFSGNVDKNKFYNLFCK